MKTGMILLSVLLLITSCSSVNRGLAGDEPPKAMVEIDNEKYETILGSYCWSGDNSGICVDTLGPVELLAGEEPIVIKGNAVIRITLDYDPLPNKFHVTQISNGNYTQIEMEGAAFKAPIKKGIYYYNYGVWWMDNKVENLSNGSASYNFVVEVR